MSEAESLFERLTRDPVALLNTRARDVVHWRWATPWASLHEREPLFILRTPHAELGTFIDEPSGPLDTRYGFDENNRIVIARGELRAVAGFRIHLAEQAWWWNDDGTTHLSASHGEVGEGQFFEVTDYRHDGGELVTTTTSSGSQEPNHDLEVSTKLRWFEYDPLQRLIQVTSISLGSFGAPDAVFMGAQRIRWDSSGHAAAVTAAASDRLDRSAAPEDLRDWVRQWAHTGKDWHVIYDFRTDAPAATAVPLVDVFQGLEFLLADAIVAAVGRAVVERRVLRPFLTVIDDPLSLEITLIDQAERDQRQHMVRTPPDLQFSESVDLSFVDELDEATLTRIRQIKQSSDPDSRNPVGARTPVELPSGSSPSRGELALQLRYALLRELNERTIGGTTEDFLALVRVIGEAPWETAASVLGADRVAAFRQSLQPTTHGL